ncbi:platelet-derived growth factor receptor beta-like [Centroberyx affinis]|uniref:platelet-derived growth factor receptor beta-like n=1 Tax=Centroberyx affinis TaxID=166261 RepID=UPI003A5C3961
MTPSIGEETGSLPLLHFLLVLFLVCPDGGVALELNPSASEVLLNSNSSFTVVCSGWGQVSWRLPQESLLDGVLLENRGSSSILQLHNATWRHSGKYICEEAGSDETRELDVFIPGQGPDEWFVPTGPGVVMKEGEEGTIPAWFPTRGSTSRCTSGPAGRRLPGRRTGRGGASRAGSATRRMSAWPPGMERRESHRSSMSSAS